MKKMLLLIYLFPTLALAGEYDTIVTNVCGKTPLENVIMKDLNIKDLDLATKIPKSFAKMPEILANIKYPALKGKPKFIYSTDDGAVSFGITNKASSNLVDIDKIKDGMLNLTKALNPKAIPLTVEGNKAWLVVFDSQASDSKIMNIQLFTMTKTKFIVGAFNMTDKYKDQYCAAGVLSLMSIREIDH